MLLWTLTALCLELPVLYGKCKALIIRNKVKLNHQNNLKCYTQLHYQNVYTFPTGIFFHQTLHNNLRICFSFVSLSRSSASAGVESRNFRHLHWSRFQYLQNTSLSGIALLIKAVHVTHILTNHLSETPSFRTWIFVKKNTAMYRY